MVERRNSAIQKVSGDPEGFKAVDIINIASNNMPRAVTTPPSYSGYRILYSSNNVHNYNGKYEWIAVDTSPLSEYIDAFLISRKRNNKINEILT